MKVELIKEYRFESAHQLPRVPPGHRCARLHGHSFRMELTLVEIRDQLRLVLEASALTREELKAEFRKEIGDLKVRIEILERVVTEHSRILAEHSAEIRALRRDFDALRVGIDQKASTSAVASLEERVARVEEGLGI